MDLNSVPAEAVGGTMFGLPMIYLFFKRVFLKGAIDKTATTSEEAKTDVIKMLSDQVERMAEINSRLEKRLNEIQIENISFRKEISNLHDIINEMNEQFMTISRRKTDSKLTINDRRRS